jgi:nucleoside-diphosphate-sugar epimerase
VALFAITGGSGFLGLHLARRLLADDQTVRTLDLEPLDAALVEQGAEGIVGDVRSARDAAMLCAGADVLVHTAAALPIQGFDEIHSVNVGGTAVALAAAGEAGVRRVIYLSSAVVYGLPESLPLTEATWTAPIEPYGRSKVEAERVCRQFSIRGLETVVLRPQASIGPGRLGAFGLLFDWLREGRRIYILGSGENRYQLLDVDDLVEAIRLAAERPVAGETFNLGATEFGSVAEDLAALIAHAGSPSRVTSLPARTARLTLRGLARARLSPLSEWHYRTADKDVYCDVSKAERELGWAPRYSNREALIRAYDWHAAHRDELDRHGLTHRTPWREKALGLVRRVS